MNKINVTGPPIEEILEKFKISITSRNSAKIVLYREKDRTTLNQYSTTKN